MVDVGVGGESDGCGGGRDTSWKILLSHLYVFCYIDQMCYKIAFRSVGLSFFIKGINDDDHDGYDGYNCGTINTGTRVRL